MYIYTNSLLRVPKDVLIHITNIFKTHVSNVHKFEVKTKHRRPKHRRPKRRRQNTAGQNAASGVLAVFHPYPVNNRPNLT